MEKGESRNSRLSCCVFDPLAIARGSETPSLTVGPLPRCYAGAGVPPVIGGRIGLSGFADGSFAAGSSC